MDSFLQQPPENCRRRFVLAHEIGHVLINRADPLHNPARFDRDYDRERDYNFQELRERLTLGECKANTMAALLLMPKPLVQGALHRHTRQNRIPVYGECVLHPSIKTAVNAMANELGVSFSALLIQLKKYNMVERYDIQEYFLQMRQST